MWVVKQCTCGSITFADEPDDNVLICTECGCKARFQYIKESEVQGE